MFGHALQTNDTNERMLLMKHAALDNIMHVCTWHPSEQAP